jgi:nucleotide-binding universal stress UspA family protein
VQVIGAAYTPTDEGREALHAAAVLARAGRTRLRVITVLPDEHAEDQSHGLMAEQHREVNPAENEAARHRLGAQAELREALAELAAGVDAEVDVLVGEPGDGLVSASDTVDLLVMGSRALGPKRSVLLGSVSRKVAAEAACPVLILPRGAGERSDALLADAQAQAARPD